MIYLCLGRREMGKSTLALFLIRKQPVRVIFDPRGLFPTSVSSPVVVNASDLGARMNDIYEAKSGQVVIVPDGKTQPMFEATAIEVKRWLRDSPLPIALLVDELRFVDPDESTEFDWILRCAGRATVTVVLTAHRPVDVPTDIRAIADMWCIFQTTQEHDLKVIAERCSPDVAEKVSRLRPREFVSWDDTRGVMTFHGFPERWYVPLGQSANLPQNDDRPIESLHGEPAKKLLF